MTSKPNKHLYIIPHQHAVTSSDRTQIMGHKAVVVWFTGLSGSGKSTIAGRLEQQLMGKGIHTYILDGDNIRSGLNVGLSFSREDRIENLRRVAEVAKLFVDAGLIVLSAFISPLREDREMVAKIIGADNFVEIFVDTSVEECARRDVKGLYQKALSGEIENFTGVSAPYEAPEHADLVLKTEGNTVEACVERVFSFLKNEKKLWT